MKKKKIYHLFIKFYKNETIQMYFIFFIKFDLKMKNFKFNKKK